MSPRLRILGLLALCTGGCAQLLGVDEYEVQKLTGTCPADSGCGAVHESDTKGAEETDGGSTPVSPGSKTPGPTKDADGGARRADPSIALDAAADAAPKVSAPTGDPNADAGLRVVPAPLGASSSGSSSADPGDGGSGKPACDPSDNSGCAWPNGRCDPETRECRPPPSCDGLESLCGGSGAYTGGYGGSPGWVMSGEGAAGPESDYGYPTGPLPQDCCASPLVQGGSFNRSNDANAPATVSDFRLDQFEVVVGRFQRFVNAWLDGYRPAAGDGKHAYAHGGSGLVDADGHYETGWDSRWVSNLATTAADWDANLSCAADYPTWPSKTMWPQTCVTWYEAYAFCIWDGGFLPSEAEWNYAAAGGSAQRPFPWGDVAPDPSLAVYGCLYNGTGTCSDVRNLAQVGSATAGDGFFGQSDLAGNVWEWNLDWYGAAYAPACEDCIGPAAGQYRVRRGSSFRYDADSLSSSFRSSDAALNRRFDGGFRCARAP